jgi:DNA-binding NarL/FixJ family response regulator
VVQAVRGTVAGKAFLDPTVAAKVIQRVATPQTRAPTTLTAKLTEREIDVLKLIARGMNNADIAQRLHLSEGTVRNYVSVILDKLNLTDRTQAAVLALQHGLGND